MRKIFFFVSTFLDFVRSSLNEWFLESRRPTESVRRGKPDSTEIFRGNLSADCSKLVSLIETERKSNVFLFVSLRRKIQAKLEDSVQKFVQSVNSIEMKNEEKVQRVFPSFQTQKFYQKFSTADRQRPRKIYSA